jgi:hypothetical protein
VGECAESHSSEPKSYPGNKRQLQAVPGRFGTFPKFDAILHFLFQATVTYADTD